MALVASTVGAVDPRSETVRPPAVAPATAIVSTSATTPTRTPESLFIFSPWSIYLLALPVPDPCPLPLIGRAERNRVFSISLSAGALRCAFVRLGHRAVVERLVEDVVRDTTLARDLEQRAAGGGGLLDDLARRVVADVGIERGRGRE